MTRAETVTHGESIVCVFFFQMQLWYIFLSRWDFKENVIAFFLKHMEISFHMQVHIYMIFLSDYI